MSLPLRIKLRQEFREPLKSDVGFVGREAELSRLVSLFQRRSAATVLVSGHRGVGKSALVEEALTRAKKDRKKRIVARLTLPHVYRRQKDQQDDKEIRDHILRSLARSLYFALKDTKSLPDDLKERAQALYNKTYLRELEEHRVVESIAEAEARRQTSTRTESTFRPSKAFSMILGPALAVGVATGGLAVIYQVAQQFGWGFGAGAGGLLALVAILSGYTMSKSKSEVSSVTDTVMEKDNLTQVGVLDMSPETLEFELRDLVDQLAKRGWPCVFVIDELDKLETEKQEEGATLETHVIFRIVASLKNFFTLGSGIYVFISGEDFFAQLGSSIAAGGYQLPHTLFTDRVFVHVLHYSDVERLIDGLLVGPPPKDPTYRRFRNYLCWESRNHVFDLLSLISEFVVFDKKEGPVLEAREAGQLEGHWQEGNLPKDWQTAAGLQKFVGASYDESHRPGARLERFNQAIWLTLLKVAGRLFEGETLEADDEGIGLPEEEWLEHLTDRELDDLTGAIDRLLAKMERYGAVRVEEATRTESREQGDIEVRFKRYALIEGAPYPPESLGREADLIPFEKSFLQLSERIDRVVENLQAAGVDPAESNAELSEVRKLAKAVSDTSPRSSVPKSQVRDGFKRADTLAIDLVESGIASVVTQWAGSIGAQVSKNVEEVENRTGQTWETSLTEFPDLASAIKQTKVDYFIVGGPSSDNQVLVIDNLAGEDLAPISDAYAESLTGDKGRERRKQRLPVVVVTRAADEAGKKPEIPKESIEEIEEIGLWYFFWSFFDPKKTDKKTQDLVGWEVFALDPELKNIHELAEFIDRVSVIPETPAS